MNYFSTRELKQRSKATMRRRMAAILLTAAVYILVNFLLGYLSDELSGVNDWNREFNRRMRIYASEIQSMTDPNEVYELIDRISMPTISHFEKGPVASILSVLVMLMSEPLAAGYTFHVLSESRGRDTKITSIFFGFRVMWKVLAINILTGLLVALGFIFLIVPGIIFMLRYSLAVFVLLDDPTKGPVQCMKESAQLMRGGKWNYFKLVVSFLPWYLLSSLVTLTVGVPLLNVYLTPYINLTSANFYLSLAPNGDGPSQSPEIQF